MKRIYLILIMLAIYANVSAQSLQLSNVYITGDPFGTLEGKATVENISSNPIDVEVVRVVNNYAPGHLSYFCWVQCYPDFVSTSSPDFITITPGTPNSNSFRGDVEVNGIPGLTEVSYCFYDANNPSDSVCVSYSYLGPTGINDIPSNKNFISKPQPNPASEYTTFMYNKTNPASKAVVRIFDMLGSKVKEVNLTESKSVARVNLTSLKSGLYFYTYFIDNKSVSSGKLVINRN